MDAKTKKTLIIVGSSTLIGFLGDVVMYSVASSKGGPFKINMPTGKALAQVVIIGFITGILVDFAVNAIIESQKSSAEKVLDKIVKDDLAKLESGVLKAVVPQKIVWA